jgi:hypothetical protein
LTDDEVIKKEWKSGFSEIAYNAFVRARSSLKDCAEITDRTEGKAMQRIENKNLEASDTLKLLRDIFIEETTDENTETTQPTEHNQTPETI